MEDHGLTGTESSKRKGFQKLLADAKSEAFSAVLLSEQSLMSREDVFDAMVHWKLHRDAGVKIDICQRGELDFTNHGGVICDDVHEPLVSRDLFDRPNGCCAATRNRRGPRRPASTF